MDLGNNLFTRLFKYVNFSHSEEWTLEFGLKVRVTILVYLKFLGLFVFGSFQRTDRVKCTKVVIESDQLKRTN